LNFQWFKKKWDHRCMQDLYCFLQPTLIANVAPSKQHTFYIKSILFFLNPERSKCISNVYAVWKKKLFQLSVHVTYWNNFSYAYHFCFYFCVFNIFNSARINLHFYFTIFFFFICALLFPAFYAFPSSI
jgi:hypothetical protein